MRLEVSTWLDPEIEVESHEEGWITLSYENDMRPMNTEITIFIPDNPGDEIQDSIDKLAEIIAACQLQVERLREMRGGPDPITVSGAGGGGVRYTSGEEE